MNFSPLTAISPIDGRYFSKTKSLSPFFSEFGLIRYRVQVEVEYFIALTKMPIQALSSFPTSKIDELKAIYQDFTEADAQWIKDSEKITNHDVKAVEYFLKDRMKSLGLGEYLEFIQ
jgi:adenylosuccinate lyase